MAAVAAGAGMAAVAAVGPTPWAADRPRRASSWPTRCGPSCWPAPPPRACAACGPARRAARARRALPRAGHGGSPRWRRPPAGCAELVVARVARCVRAGVLPPVECCRGVRPRKAARWRPEVNWVGSIANARLIAVTGPIPGTPSSSRLIGCALCKASNSASRAAISASRWATCCRAARGRPWPMAGWPGWRRPRRAAARPGSCPAPRPARTPRHGRAARCEAWVRCFTNSSRIFSSMPCAWASADFTATSAIPGRAAASAMASASMRSFLPRRTNGLTYCGGISRTRWPSASARRPQWCEPPHASSTTSVGASPARNASQRPRRSSRRSTGPDPTHPPRAA